MIGFDKVFLTMARKCRTSQRHTYVRIIIVQTPMSTPMMTESRRRRDLIIDNKLLTPGMIPV